MKSISNAVLGLDTIYVSYNTNNVTKSLFIIGTSTI